MSSLNRVLRADFPCAAERIKAAAAASLKAAKAERVQTRRERIEAQRASVVPPTDDERLEIPAEWREDEITRLVAMLPRK